MSSYEKVVKLACKPKAAPPKPKYLDTILAATWSEDGAVHDVCKALSPRFREPNAIVVFKALIVLHTMIRNGATDNVLGYLSTSEVLRLKNVSAGNWEGYNAPQNLQLYAIYLDSRIRAYRDLKHDAVRVQAESNRDMRNNNNIDEDMAYRGERPAGKGAQPSRSKTLMGRKLRIMSVEKGLLRETKAVQRMIDSLVECRFYLDDLGDELTITALRMLIKDLLILFQAGNEGVINVLEHYFEMSQVDAQSALNIYRHFCKQTERVVEYLGVATKLQNLLNVPIPNLKHAPVSLAGALEEYLNDPNFEQNRIEYKANKLVAENNNNGIPTSAITAGGSSSSSSAASKAATKVSFAEVKKPERSASMPVKLSVNPAASRPESNQAMQDFFAAIEEEQPTMFNPQTGSSNPNYFQQQATSNPFGAFGPQPTGIQQPSQPQLPAAFMMPQQTAFQQPQQPNAFGLQLPQEQQHRPFHSFLQPQNTGFLQPQPTGSNPFRQSMFVMQPTGVGSSPFGMGSQPSPFQLQGQNMAATAQVGPSPFTTSPFPTAGPSAFSSVTPFAASPFTQNSAAVDLPARPASTPLTSFGSFAQSSSISPPAAQPVKAHQTGSRNPFGIPVAPAPPIPKAPTLMELAMGGSSTNNSIHGQQTGVNGNQPQQQQQQLQPQTGSFGGTNAFGAFSSGGGDGKGDMANVASSFSLKNTTMDGNKTNFPAVPNASGPFLNTQNTSTTGSGFSDSMFSSLNSQPTGATSTSSPPSVSISPGLKPQTTGYSGLKAFKPSSSFGTTLLESLPPVTMPNSSSTSTAGGASAAATSSPGGMPSFGAVASGLSSQPTRMNSQPTGAPSFGGFGGGSSLGVGLRPQMTGGGANPFRASMFTGSTGGPMNGTTGAFPSSTSSPSAFTGTTGNFSAGLSASNGTPFGAFGAGAFGAGFNPNSGAQDLSKQQQQPQHIGSASLI